MTFTQPIHPPAPLDALSPSYTRLRDAAIAATEATAQPLQLISACTPDADLVRHAVRQSSCPAVYAVDLAVVARQLRLFRALLPNVKPYYAVKCNPDPVLLSFLARLGLSFDCASGHEISLIETVVPARQISERVVFANPFKTLTDLKYAHVSGIDLMTFDSLEELEKISLHYHTARLLLRVAVDDTTALCPLSPKFGARVSELASIFARVHVSGANLVGVAFHVGSGAKSVATYVDALKMARKAFDLAHAAGLAPLTMLDIGGGFPGYDGEAPVTFVQIANAVRNCIATLFGEEVRVIAEPGRFFATAAYSLGAQVVLSTERQGKACHYLADGVFGSFRDAWLLNMEYQAELLEMEKKVRERNTWERCDLYGPTRDPVDVIRRDVLLPKLRVGDWLRFPNAGAYTRSMWTKRCEVEAFETVYCFRGCDEDKMDLIKYHNDRSVVEFA